MNLKNLIKIKGIIILITNFVKKNTVFLFFILTLIILFLAGLIFYQYGYRATYLTKERPGKEIKIDYQLYQKIISRFKEREKNIQEATSKEYKDPFK